MKIATIFFALFVFASAEVYAPHSHPVIPSLALTDGRTLKDAKILSDTAYTVSVASGGKIVPVEKKLLPPEILAQWPVDEERGQKEREHNDAVARDAANRIAAADARKAKIVAGWKADKAKQDAEKAAQEAAQKAAYKKAYDKALKKAAAGTLGIFHDGLLIEGVGSSFGKIYVLVKNVSAGEKTFDWQSLRLIPYKIDEEFPLAGVATQPDDVEDLNLRPSQRRVFRMLQITELEVKAVHWKGESATIAVKQLYRQRSQVAMGDQYAKQRREEHAAYLAGEEPDEITTILLNATRPHVGYELRK